MPRKKQHCPKRMKWEGAEGEGPPRSPSQQQQGSIDTASSEDEDASDQSEEEEEGQSGVPTTVARHRDGESGNESNEEVVAGGDTAGTEEKLSEGEVKLSSDCAKILNLNKSSEGERMLGPEALITRDPSSPRGGATVASQPTTPSPSPPSTSPNHPTPLLTPQIQPIIDITRPTHVIPQPHHQPLPLHPTSTMLGPSAAILPQSAAAILSTPPASVMLNPSTAAAILGSTPGVLTARPIISSEPTAAGNPEILDFSTKGRKRGRRREGRDSGDEVDSEEDAESDMDQDEAIEEEGGVLNLSKPTTPQVSTIDLSSPLDLSVNRRKRQRLATSEDVTMTTVPGTACQTPQNLHVGVNTPTTTMSPLASLASSIATHLLPHRRGSQQGRSEGFKQPPTPWSTGSNQVPPSQNLPFPFYQSGKGQQPHHHHPPTTQHQTNSLRQASPDPWNGKVKGNMAGSQGYNLASSVAPSDATKALEKMSELSKLGSDSVREDVATLSYLRQHQAGGGSGAGGSVSSRQSAWQSHWLSKGAEQARDVLKCVWCRQSFQSLSALTVHMKEAKHCGVQGMPQGQVPVSVAISTTQTTQHQTSTVQSTSNISGSPSMNPSGSGNNQSGGQQGGKDLSLLIKETMPLPRKLVRGQDVWLGKGAEQTRQILKCMWCGQSFRSLAEMTSHMQQTQHYTNIVSQEQIISWKSADDRGGGGGTGGASGGTTGGTGTGGNSNNTSTGGSSGNAGSQGGHVTAVLTCKVCDEAFGSLKELSNHMVKNAHYKEHIMRSITEGGTAGQIGNSAQSRRRGVGSGNSPSAIAAREKRKKSLPVRKLLELERAQNELKNGGGDGGKAGNMAMLANPGGGRITCEKCGERIETAMFVEHIRQCVGGSVASLNQQRNLLKSALMSEVQEAATAAAAAAAAAGGRTPDGTPLAPPQRSSKMTTPDKTDSSTSTKGDSVLGSGIPGSSPSVLNAIEKLIEKSFDSRMRQGYAGAMTPGGTGNIAAGTQPIGSSILKRLGIDETVDYTKPLVDPHTMNLLRGYHAYGQFGGLLNPVGQSAGKRERSGSESSSVSDRCGGGGSVTPPDRRQKSLTPRSTPEALQSPPVSTPGVNMSNSTPPTSQPATPMAVDEKRDRKEDDVSSDEEGEKEVGGGNLDEGGERGKEEEGEAAGGDKPHEVEVKDGPDREESKNREEDEGEVAGSDRDAPDDDEMNGDVDEHTGKQSPPSNTDEKEEKSSKSKSEERSKGDPKLESKLVVKIEDEPDKDVESLKGSPKTQTAGSLGALSSMFDSLSGDQPSASGQQSSGSATGGTTSHPLAALQKLCDKTESHHNHSGSSGHQSVHTRSPSVGSSSSTLNANYPSSSNTSPSNPGAILAFSWACSDAVVSDSLLKCAFCETPFVSKGAYRHHLSKMHFVKDGVIPEPSPAGSTGGSQSVGQDLSSSQGGSSRNDATSPKNSSGTQGGNNSSQEDRSPQVSTPPGTSSSDESPHSKFLKYTELAKQLSSKYV